MSDWFIELTVGFFWFRCIAQAVQAYRIKKREEALAKFILAPLSPTLRAAMKDARK